MTIPKVYRDRFSESQRAQNDKVWRILCRHFLQRYVKPTDTVLDLGAGYCEFINHIECKVRIAVYLSPDIEDYAGPDVRILMTSGADLGQLDDDSIDVVFASNFFEHLPSEDGFLKTLSEVRRVLRSGGRLLILQPNIRVLGGKYWDFLDHHLLTTDRTLVEALNLIDMQIGEVRPRFLPYTTRTAIPKHPFLVRLYLLLPPVHLTMGGQAWDVATKP